MTAVSWLRRKGALALLGVALALVAGCVRSGPPAPVLSGQASTGGGRGTMHPFTPHPDQVVVREGDTLYAISRRYDVPVRSIIDANGLAPPFGLAAGRALVLPQVHQHVVQSGDTIYSISRLYGVDASSLTAANHLTPPYTIRIGQPLMLPAPVEVAQMPSAPPSVPAGAAYPAYSVAPVPASPPPGGPAGHSAIAVVPLELPPAPAAAPPPPPPRPLLAAPAAVAPVAQSETPPLPPKPPAPVASPPPPEAAPAPSEQTAALPLPPPPPRGGRSFLWPVQGRIIGNYGPGPNGTQNDGINIAAPEGTPVVAAEAGVVAYVGNELRGYGNLVLIKHADGYMTAYAHNKEILVKRGENVRRGQAIARVGETGVVSEPQLHFELRRGTRALDPTEYLAPLPTASG